MNQEEMFNLSLKSVEFIFAQETVKESLKSKMFELRKFLWLSDMDLIQTLSGHSGRVWHASWSPKGSILATCGEDTNIRLWSKEGLRKKIHLERSEILPFFFRQRMEMPNHFSWGSFSNCSASGLVSMWKLFDLGLFWWNCCRLGQEKRPIWVFSYFRRPWKWG